MIFLLYATIWYLAGLGAVIFVCRDFIKEMDREEIFRGLALSLFGLILWFFIFLDKLCDIWGDENDKDYKQ